MQAYYIIISEFQLSLFGNVSKVIKIPIKTETNEFQIHGSVKRLYIMKLYKIIIFRNEMHYMSSDFFQLFDYVLGHIPSQVGCFFLPFAGLFENNTLPCTYTKIFYR